MVILVPLVYSVVLLVVQLNLPHEGCTFFDENGDPIESEFTRESFVVTTKLSLVNSDSIGSPVSSKNVQPS